MFLFSTTATSGSPTPKFFSRRRWAGLVKYAHSFKGRKRAKKRGFIGKNLLKFTKKAIYSKKKHQGRCEFCKEQSWVSAQEKSKLEKIAKKCAKKSKNDFFLAMIPYE